MEIDKCFKALDSYILSDEEIIEGAYFSDSRFQRYLPQFKVNLTPKEISENSYRIDILILNYLFVSKSARNYQKNSAQSLILHF